MHSFEGSKISKYAAAAIICIAVAACGGGGGYSGGAGAGNGFAPHSDVPADTSDFSPQPVGARNSAPADDDIPF